MLFLFELATIACIATALDVPCEFGYSPCDPPTVDGECVFSPGEQCNVDSVGLIFCCIAAPNITISPVSTTESETTDECRDLVPYCFSQYCEKYPDLMNEICPVTCDACNSTSSDMFTDSTMTTVPQEITTREDCSDNRESCRKLAKHCRSKKYATYMQKHCKETCGLCGSESESGSHKHSHGKSHEHSHSQESGSHEKSGSKSKEHGHSKEKHPKSASHDKSSKKKSDEQ